MFSLAPFIAVDVNHKKGSRQKSEIKIKVKWTKNPFMFFIGRIYPFQNTKCLLLKKW